MNKGINFVCVILIMVVAYAGLGIMHYATVEELNNTKKVLSITKDELSVTKESLQAETNKTNNLRDELDKTMKELEDAKEKNAYLDKQNNAHNGWDMCWRDVKLEQWEIDFFAKLLVCEAGGMGHEGQFWTASAILNLSEVKQMSIWEMGHQVSIFEVAPWVDNAKPTQQQYDIIYEVLNNGWIADVAYFRTDYPHSFGNFMIKIENVCFSSP